MIFFHSFRQNKVTLEIELNNTNTTYNTTNDADKL